MNQMFKTVYFQDHPASTSQKRNLKIAFGPSDEPVYKAVETLSSQQIRELMGYDSFIALRDAATINQDPINSFCLRKLRHAVLHDKRPLPQPLPGFETQLALFDPVQATFRGGKKEPLHNWYPYLEGYSPEFVERLLNDFCPKADRILDPFAGSGTTPITASRLGRVSWYCEINPLLQFLVRTKIEAFNLPKNEREDVISGLRDIAAHLKERALGCEPDISLLESFSLAFADSRFFSAENFELVLRLRTLLDGIACASPRFADIATIAVLSALIPASLLIRRGDLRFKNKRELQRTPQSLFELIAERLEAMAADLGQIYPLPVSPQLLCSDARDMFKVPAIEADAIITSPPYLNGTNYFRNTKVELWFLRCLKSPEDLARFRQAAVTAGINDVTVGKPTARVCDSVDRVVKALEKNAYDSRIPLMVQTYFYDVANIFDALSRHLAPSAKVLVDIGDSSYGGVRVETPTLIAEILQERGFTTDQQITLRRRLSRGGEALSQMLLVMRAPQALPHRSEIKKETPWKRAWQHFRNELPHQRGERAKRNWGHPLHSLCSYQGKMKPSLAAQLVKSFVSQGARLLDPFGGVGTIPFEAALQGVHSWSFDISPAAVQIAAAKLQPASVSACDDLLRRLEEFLSSETVSPSEVKDAQSIHFNGVLSEYFHPRTFKEILLARRFFLKYPPLRPEDSLVFAALLHILHGNRPYALSRRSHPITPFYPTGEFEYRGLMERLKEKIRRSLVVPLPDSFASGHSLFQDATTHWPEQIESLDAIITSPPFFDSTRFYLANWIRLWFCGWTAEDFKHRPLAFVDERQKSSFEVYEPVFRQARERLKHGGVMVLHLGKSRKCDMVNELVKIARRWFHAAASFNECVAHCESHGIRDKGTVVEHQYLVLD